MIGERIKDIRDEKNITQEELANILGVTRAHCSHWENETKLMPLKKMNYLCNYFNINLDYLIGKTRNDSGNGFHELDSKVIGKNLKKLREDNSITQNDLAKLLNTTQSTISAYESGKTVILTAFAIQIVNKFNISLDWLCGRK